MFHRDGKRKSKTGVDTLRLDTQSRPLVSSGKMGK